MILHVTVEFMEIGVSNEDSLSSVTERQLEGQSVKYNNGAHWLLRTATQ